MIIAVGFKVNSEWTEFRKYRVIQDRGYLSDFDRFMLDADGQAGVTL